MNEIETIIEKEKILHNCIKGQLENLNIMLDFEKLNSAELTFINTSLFAVLSFLAKNHKIVNENDVRKNKYRYILKRK